MKTNAELRQSAFWQMVYAFLLGVIGFTITTSPNEVVAIGGWIILGINIFTMGFAFGRYCVYVGGTSEG